MRDVFSVKVKEFEKVAIGDGVSERVEPDVIVAISFEGLEVNEVSPDRVILVDTVGCCEEDAITVTLYESIPVGVSEFVNNEVNVGTRDVPDDRDTLGEGVNVVVTDDDNDKIEDRVDENERAGEFEVLGEREDETETRAFDREISAEALDENEEMPTENVALKLRVDKNDIEGKGDIDGSEDGDREV